MGDYDNFAQEYADGTEDLEASTREHFYSLLPRRMDDMVLLDVGCGSGHDAKYYARRGAKVFGIDVSEREILFAKRMPDCFFTLASMDNLPFGSKSFDIVTSLYALQASQDVSASLNEMLRVAKSGAYVLVLAKHPFRNLMESHINDHRSDYFEKRMVTSRIFKRAITLAEPGHTLMDYLDSSVLEKAGLELFEEHTDYPASDQVIQGLVYPTYMIMKFRKR
jgi:ubiquinone/menaquinone biosynthesis C-methylase UbiE